MKEKKKLCILLAVIVVVLGTLGVIKKISPAYAIETGVVEGLYITIDSNTVVTAGDKVYVNLTLDREKWSDNVKLLFHSSTSGREFSVYLKDVGLEKPYFIVPEDAKADEYEISEILLYFKNSNQSKKFYTFIDAGDYDARYINLQDKKYITVKEAQNHSDTAIKLNRFNLKTTEAKSDEIIYVDLDYSGYVDSVNVTFRNTETNEMITRAVNNYEGSAPEINLDSQVKLASGKYRVDSINLCHSLDCLWYINDAIYDGGHVGMQRKLFTFDRDMLTIKSDTIETINLKAINLNTHEAVPGEKVSVDVNADKEIASALLIFYDKKGNNSFSAYVKNMKYHAYFMLPSIVEQGDYRLQKVIIKDNKGNSSSYLVPEFEENSYTDPNNGVFYETINLKVNEVKLDNKDIIVFNMEDYDAQLVRKIDSLSDDAVITAICDNYSSVTGQLFKQIKETRKTLILVYGESEWVFNGTDIVNPKPIDVSMLLKNIKNSDFSNSNISGKISEEDTSILSFSNNGTLPGKALIRLDSTQLDPKFGNNDIFVYYYNSDNDTLMKVALEVQKIEGYYEFYINHNSDYILSKTKLDEKIVSNDNSMLVLNNSSTKSNNNDIDLYVVIGALSVLVLGLVIIVIIKTKK